MTSDDLTQLPEADQRHLYDAFNLQIRYNRGSRKATLRVRISADTAPRPTVMINGLTRSDRDTSADRTGLTERTKMRKNNVPPAGPALHGETA